MRKAQAQMVKKLSKARALLGVLAGLFISTQVLAAKPEKRSLDYLGAVRTYWLVVPEHEGGAGPMPLLLLLHGSGRDGTSLIDKWEKLAKREGFVLAAPDSLDPQFWVAPTDGPELLYEIVEVLASELPIDPKRVYLFGHSAGASFGLQMAVAESQYFAAAAVHAGMLHPQSYPMADMARRKIPIRIEVGDRDRFFPLARVRATRDALVEREFPVELNELPGHDHNYYAKAPRINDRCWEFLKRHSLDAEPEWVQYAFE
jgi:poly(3-hydroxybutyrate) depolymerase